MTLFQKRFTLFSQCTRLFPNTKAIFYYSFVASALFRKFSLKIHLHHQKLLSNSTFCVSVAIKYTRFFFGCLYCERFIYIKPRQYCTDVSVNSMRAGQIRNNATWFLILTPHISTFTRYCIQKVQPSERQFYFQGDT